MKLLLRYTFNRVVSNSDADGYLFCVQKLDGAVN